MLIWTTTPWTLPANLAIAINPDFTYVAVETKDEIYIAVKELVDDVMGKAAMTDFRIIGEMSPDDAEKAVLQASFHRQEVGRGLRRLRDEGRGYGAVHIAPGHGEEDYVTGLEYGLDVYSPVNEKGELTARTCHSSPGMNVFEANPVIIEKLKELGVFFYSEEIEHSYPHCWRCKRPVIFRATEQWFISMEKNDLRGRPWQRSKQSNGYPRGARSGSTTCYRRGPTGASPARGPGACPSPYFYCDACREPYWSQRDIRKDNRGGTAKYGADIWFEKDAAYFLPEGAGCACGKAVSSKRRISSTSGSTPAPVSPRSSRSGRS